MHKRNPLFLHPLHYIPLISPGVNLPKILYDSVYKEGLTIEENDVLVVTQKIVSKAENRLININDVKPSEKAKEISKCIRKDPRLIEIILKESNEIVRLEKNTIIVEHRLGFICANAGIDHSNVENNLEGQYLLLPENPDLSAQRIKEFIYKQTGKKIGVIIIDSQGRAWRNGIVGVSIGLSGFPAIIDMRGKEDIYGFKLKITQIAAADEVAAAASILMGQTDEKIPAVLVRGFPYKLRESSLRELLRPKAEDMFR